MPNIADMLYTGVEGGYYVLLLIFVIHAVILSYHWFTWGSSRSISLTALAVYLGGGAFLLLTLSITLTTF